MKHRSPLVTLAAVAVAFIIMFTVNTLVSPPGGSSAEPVGPSAAPASSGPAQQTTSAVATPAASATESGEELNPDSPQVTANGESLDAKPINGDEDL